MKAIILTQNKTAIVDDVIYELIGSLSWQYDQKTGYAKRKFTLPNGKRKSVYLHKYVHEYFTGEILNGKTHVVDHENNNRLDCQIDNLRKATYSQNNVNKETKTGKTGKRGISQQGMKFIAKIRFEGVTYKIGKFDTIEQAVIAWQTKATELDANFFKV